MSVNVPVNEKLKERDVNNKLQLYGIYSAFANGKVPSVSQKRTFSPARVRHASRVQASPNATLARDNCPP